MKLTMQWGGKNQRPKACKPPQKIRWNLLGIPDPRKGPPPVPIEEIRRQAQVISSRAIDQGARSQTDIKEMKKNTPTKSDKSAGKSKQGSKESEP
ncbi:MAG: hypothetical protein R3B74_01905 [Nitrospirales bacterium]|nr:hypothetical protein [Nitrospirales bacterium]